jgi:hypothetical protein
MSRGRRKIIITDDLRKELGDIFDRLNNLKYNTDTLIGQAIEAHHGTVGRWRRQEIYPDKDNMKKLKVLAGIQESAGEGAETTNVASTTGKGNTMELILKELIKLNNRLEAIEGAVLGPRQKKTLPHQSEKAS